MVSGEGSNEELKSLYRSPNIDRVIKSRILSWPIRRYECFQNLTCKPAG